MKYILRYLVWAITGIIVIATIFVMVRPRIIVHKTLDHPLLEEFKRCKNLGYEYEFYDNKKVNLSWWLKPKLRGINFSFLDTTFKSKIKYYYKIFVTLQDNEVIDVSFENFIRITPNQTLAKLIEKLEKDSSLIELIKFVHIKECHIRPFVFIFSNLNNVIHTDYGGEVVYFKLVNVPSCLQFLSQYSTFLKMTGDKGFTTSDLDSIVYIRFHNVWRIRGFIEECKRDIIEVGNYGGEPVHLKWLSDPDTINPMFLKSKIYDKLVATGLQREYINERFKLKEMHATRDADYYQRERKIIESSRITGYFTYVWTTGTWIDKLFSGLKINVYFTYYVNRKQLEAVRIGPSARNCYELINLHPIEKVMSLREIKKEIPKIDTTRASYIIDQQGVIWFENIVDNYRYLIDLESGTFEKEWYMPGTRGILIRKVDN